MKSAPATFLAATVLLGSLAVASVAQELPRDVSQSEYTEYEAWDNGKTTQQPASASVDDEMGLSDDAWGTQSASSEVEELRGQVEALRSLCAHMYEDVHNLPFDAQEIQFASMLDRLETGNDCLSQPYVTPGPACDSACCETSCCTPCCEPCCESSCYGGVALVFIRPHFHEDVAFISDPPPDDNHVQSFDRDFEPSARVWLGHTGCDGSGVRATFWHFDHGANPQSIVGTPANTPIFVQVIGAGTGIGRNAFADDGEIFTAQHSLILQTFDLEATKQFGRCRSYGVAGLGLRYANMEQEFNARVFNAGVLDEQVIHRHDFEGIGPTVSFFVHQQFGQSNWGGYGSLRGSVLFGERNQSIYEVKNAGANIGQDFFQGDEVMTIGEIGLGIQYSRSIMDDRSLVFVRGGYEAQVWFDAGGPLSTTGDLGLEGLVLAFGIEG
ncbi:MAG: Lpg1974 family pore-forming outer membrane protein [Planctomycetaceae bacterium]